MVKYKEKFLEAQKEIEKLKGIIALNNGVKLELDDENMDKENEYYFNCDHKFEIEIEHNVDCATKFFFCEKCGFAYSQTIGCFIPINSLTKEENEKLILEKMIKIE